MPAAIQGWGDAGSVVGMRPPIPAQAKSLEEIEAMMLSGQSSSANPPAPTAGGDKQPDGGSTMSVHGSAEPEGIGRFVSVEGHVIRFDLRGQGYRGDQEFTSVLGKLGGPIQSRSQSIKGIAVLLDGNCVGDRGIEELCASMSNLSPPLRLVELSAPKNGLTDQSCAAVARLVGCEVSSQSKVKFYAVLSVLYPTFGLIHVQLSFSSAQTLGPTPYTLHPKLIILSFLGTKCRSTQNRMLSKPKPKYQSCQLQFRTSLTLSPKP